MTSRSWIRRLFDCKPRTVRKNPARFRPRLEALEDRALPSTITVLTTLDGPGVFIGGANPTDSTLRGAIAHAQSGDTIVFAPILTFFGPATVNLSTVGDTSAGPSALAIPAGMDLTIEGPAGNHGMTIGRSGTTPFRLFDVAQGASLTLENLTLTGGLAQGTGVAAEGGAIYSAGTLSLNSVTVQSNQAVGSNGILGTSGGAPGGNGASAYGGGLYVAAGTVTLSDTTISANTAQGGNGGNGRPGPSTGAYAGGNAGTGGAASGGGLYVAGGTVTLTSDTLAKNQADGGAGGVGGSLMDDGVGGTGSGGGIAVAGGTVTSNNDFVHSNQASGGQAFVDGFSTPAVSGSANGGGIAMADGTFKSSNDFFIGNQANGANGVSVVFYPFGGAGSGGGIDIANGMATFTHDGISSNQANGGLNGGVSSGGGVYVAAGTVTFNADTLNRNRATGGSSYFGAGIVGGAASGGGIEMAGGTVQLTNDTLSGNQAMGGAGSVILAGGAASGGGMAVADGTLIMSNDTFSSNQAQGGTGGRGGALGGLGGTGGAGSGGGIYVGGGNVASSKDTLSSNQAQGGTGGTGMAVALAGDGGAAAGGGIYVAQGNVTLSNDTLRDNQANGGNGNFGSFNGGAGGAAAGGGAAVADGTVTLINDTLSGNRAQGGNGGGAGLEFGNNGGTASGGGMDVAGGMVTLSNDTLSGNQANGGKGGKGFLGGSGGAGLGGGLYVAGSTVLLWDDTLSNNQAQGCNGAPGFFADGLGGAGSGGGMYVAEGSIVNMINVTLSGNQARGGNEVDGLTLSGKTTHAVIGGGYGGAGSGGGLYVAGGMVTLSNDTLSGNQALGGNGANENKSTTAAPPPLGGGLGGAASGGGMAVADGTVLLFDVTLSGNRALGGNGGSGNGGEFGGGIGGAGSGGGMSVADGTVSLINDTLSGNQAKGGYAGSGSGFPNPTKPVPSSLVSKIGGGGAGGAGSGGGLYVAAGTVSLLNDTLSTNQATGAAGGLGSGRTRLSGGPGGNGQGGGLYLAKSTSTTSNSTILTNTLIAKNTVTAGLGGPGGPGTNTGPSGQTPGPDACGTALVSDHDLIGNSSDFVPTQESGDVLDLTPDQLKGLLDPRGLHDNGGPTQTIALPLGSLAIDAGNGGALGLPSTDQRGFARISGTAVDIGAFEVQQPVFNTAALPDGTYGTRYSQTITATATGGAAGPFTFAYTVGTLPPGLSLASDGSLSGIPTAPGTYSFTVTATDSDSDSGSQSYTVNIAKATPTVQLSDDGGTYNQKPFAATASITGVNGVGGSSLEGVPLNLTYYASGTPLVGAPTLPGTYTVQASFAGSADYTSASATTTFTIQRPNATINVTGYNVTYNGVADTATGTATGVNGVNLSTDLSLGDTIHTDAGTYTDTWTFHDPNGLYQDAIGTVSDSIGTAPLTVTVTAGQSMTYGSTVPALTYTYTGLVNGDTSASFSGALATTATSSSSVGGYAITQGTLAATGNYTIDTFNAGSLTVNPAPLTVTPTTDQSMTYGSTVPTLTYTYTGLVNNDTSASFSGALTTPATSSSSVGGYAINQGTLAAIGNYEIGTFNAGTLTVNPAPLTVTPTAGQSMIYGATVPALTYTYTGLVNGDTSASFSGALTTPATSSSSVGGYAITQGTLAATGNYTIDTFNAGSLTVNPAPLIITANNASKSYGTSATFSSTAFTETGLLTANGDRIAGVTETSPGAAVSAAVGTYDIVPSAATGTGLSNYTLTYAPGTLTVFPTLTVPAAQTAQTADENVRQAIRGISLGTGLSGSVTLTLGVSYGTLTVGTTSGLTVTGNGSGALSLTGSTASVNAALASLAYLGDLNFSGADTLSLTVRAGSFSANAGVAITVVSLTQEAANLKAQVSALQSAGVLTQGQASALLIDLSLNGNNGDAAKVQAFVDEVGVLGNAGILTPAQADALLGPGNNLLIGLDVKSTGFAELPAGTRPVPASQLVDEVFASLYHRQPSAQQINQLVMALYDFELSDMAALMQAGVNPLAAYAWSVYLGMLDFSYLAQDLAGLGASLDTAILELSATLVAESM